MNDSQMIRQLMLRAKLQPNVYGLLAEVAAGLSCHAALAALFEQVIRREQSATPLLIPPAVLIAERELRVCRFYRFGQPQAEIVIPCAQRHERTGDISRPVAGRYLTPHAPMHAWPDWLQALALLITLTRPEWIYAVVCTARNASAGWFDRLADCCGAHSWAHARLLASVSELAVVTSELERALDMGSASSDPVDCFLVQLANQPPLPTGCAGLQTFPDRVWSLLTARVRESCYPALGAALEAVRGLNRASCGATLVQLCQVHRRDSQSLLHALVSWVLDTRNDGPDVLGGIANLPRSAEATPEAVIRPGDLVDRIGENFDVGSPGDVILQGLLRHLSWEDILTAMTAAMPDPWGLTPDDLKTARDWLQAWERVLPRSVDPNLQPGEWILLALPTAFWQDRPSISAGVRILTDWLQNRQNRPRGWGNVAFAHAEEPVLRAALAAAWFDELIKVYIRCYREERVPLS